MRGPTRTPATAPGADRATMRRQPAGGEDAPMGPRPRDIIGAGLLTVVLVGLVVLLFVGNLHT